MNLPHRIGWFMIYIHVSLWTGSVLWRIECGEFPSIVQVETGRASSPECAQEAAISHARDICEGVLICE